MEKTKLHENYQIRKRESCEHFHIRKKECCVNDFDLQERECECYRHKTILGYVNRVENRKEGGTLN